jgi:hypothetical protein
VTTINFPFWIITQRRALISMPVEAEGKPGYIAGFSNTQDATAFMLGRGATNWEFKLLSRRTLCSVTSGGSG